METTSPLEFPDSNDFLHPLLTAHTETPSSVGSLSKHLQAWENLVEDRLAVSVVRGGVQDSTYGQAASDFLSDPFLGTQKPYQGKDSRPRSVRPPEEGSYSSNQGGDKGVLFRTVYCPKEKWENETNFRSIPLEQVYQESKIQDGNPKYYSKIYSEGRLGHLGRSPRRILSCANPQEISKMAKIYVEGETLPIPSSPFRTFISPLHFHPHGVINVQDSKPERHKIKVLPRRLVKFGPIRDSLSREHRTDNQSCLQTGVYHKLEEIRPNPSSGIQLPRNDFQHKAFCGGSNKGTFCFAKINDSEVGKSGSGFVERTPGNPGEYGVHGNTYSAGQSGEATTTESGEKVVSRPGVVRKFSSNGSLVLGRDQEMVRRDLGASIRTNSSPRSSLIHPYRCVRPGVGRPYEPGDSLRSLAERRVPFSHKLQRDGGHLPCLKSVPSSSSGQNGNGLFGQQHSSFLFEKSRGDRFGQSFAEGRGDFEMVPLSSNMLVSSFHSGKVKCPSRPVESQGSGVGVGMVNSSVSSSQSLGSLGPSHGGPVCNSFQCSTANVCLPVSGRSRLEDRRSLFQLGRVDGLRVPSSSNDSVCDSEMVGRKTQAYSHNTVLAEQELARGTHVLGPCKPAEVESTGRGPDTTQNKIPTPTPSSFGSNRMATVRETLRSSGFSLDSCNLIVKGKRKSTNNLYDSRWKRWCSYCKEEDVDPCNPSESDFCNFLSFIFYNDRLAGSTLKGYRSAIVSTIALLTGRKPFFSSDIVHNLINGALNISHVNKCISRKEPWSLPLVFSFLNSSVFEPLSSCSLPFLTWKAVFLIALALVRRVGGLHALSGLKDDVIFEDDFSGVSLKFLPEFRAKTQLPMQKSKGFFIPSIFSMEGSTDDDILSCPVRALRIYRGRTEGFRRDRRRLFLSLKQNYQKDITKNTLARWIVTIVKEAYQVRDMTVPTSIRAHDTRRLGSSLAFERGVALDDIMATASWKSPNVFIDSYLKDVSHTATDGTSAIRMAILAGAGTR